MVGANPFQSLNQQEIASQLAGPSPFRLFIERMQDELQQRIELRRPSPATNTPSPAISDPRFRPSLPQPGQRSKEVEGPVSAPIRVAQADTGVQSDAASPELIQAVISQESRGDPNAVSPKGAVGLMQIMPSTARKPGFGIKPIAAEKLTDPVANQEFGTAFLNAMLKRFEGDTRRALIAFNAGPSVADRFKGDLSTLPLETQNYVASIEATIGSPQSPAEAPPEPGAQSPLPVPKESREAPKEAPQPRRRPEPAPFQAPAPAPRPEPTPLSTVVRRKPAIPAVWQQAVTKFLESKDPKDLSVVPQGSLPVLMALIGQATRSPL